MGAKLFAWLGGFAAFLGAVFFVRYSFEHDLVPPAMRVAIGYAFAGALLVGGLKVPRRRYAVTGQTLIATGIVCLYAVTYACNAVYHFAWFGPAATFTVMGLVTVLAFALAVRLDARVVAVLGLVGGFVTPLLLGTGGTHATPLFAYIAVLDVGLLALARRRTWYFLAPLAAIGTAGMELLWTGRFFVATSGVTMLGVAAVFAVIFVAAGVANQPAAPGGASVVAGSAAFVGGMAFVLGIAFLGTGHPVGTTVLFGFCGVGVLTLLALGHAAAGSGRAAPAARGRDWLAVAGLLGAAAFQYAWHGSRPAAVAPGTALRWYAAVYAVFAAYPFAFRRRFAAVTAPWAAAALVGAVQFPLVYQLVRYAWPNGAMGLLPLAFAVVPAAGLAVVQRGTVAPAPIRLNQVAWFGAATLLFVTVAFPVQFHRQWVTLGWALEGAALLGLFRRVPHRGLLVTGVVLLAASFVRLALNPAVLGYHPRGRLAVLNWYLYTYAIVTIALYTGARLTTALRARALGITIPGLLNALGTLLAFLLLNIEIADFFNAPGARVLTFQFSGNFARDMTYTIAWALFALGLLLISLWRQLRAGRRAALALLGAAALKLFTHDLSRLDALYRVGALFGVAVVAIAASVAYQRFFAGADHDAPAPGA